MDYRTFAQLVRSDLYRHTGSCGRAAFTQCMANSPGFRYSFWIRLVAWLGAERSPAHLLLPIAGLIKRHLSYKYGISIPAATQIGPGFYIGHFGDIVVNEESIIGRNCNISQGVTLGQANRGRHQGAPTIGDNVYIGPGAKVVGKVHVGSNVAIGANAVVTSDVPDCAVVGGVPAKVLSYDGSSGYVNRTDYPTSISVPEPTLDGPSHPRPGRGQSRRRLPR
jgi:serine O-acetyltransferase